MKKVYLAKSNRANPNDLSRVRTALANFDKEVEVVEYTGGKYTHDSLKACDYLVILPDLSDYDDCEDDYIIIGKGLFEQINAFETLKNGDKILVVLGTESSGTILISEYYYSDIDDDTDYIHYARLVLDTEVTCTDLTDYLDLQFDTNKISNKNTTDEMYFVLIGNK
jgi:hypothetical protein